MTHPHWYCGDRTYLEPQAKKYTQYTQTNERIAQRISSEKERPKSATLREIQRFVLPKVEEVFTEFLAVSHSLLNLSLTLLFKVSPKATAFLTFP